jgi:outer membrane protein assembly factor BamD
MKKFIYLFAFLALTACGGIKKNPKTDAEIMKVGQQYMNKEFFEEARTQYLRIKSEFPNSSHQVDAALKIAETYFREESYKAAASSYDDFIRTYPGRPEQVDALYKLGLCYVKQMPENTQRDTRASEKVLETYTQLLVEYPNSSYKDEAQKQINKANSQLARKIYLIADYYSRHKKYDSAQRRFGELIEKYPNDSLAKEAYVKRIVNLQKLGRKDEAEELRKAFELKYKFN